MTAQVVALADARRRKYERMYRAYYGDPKVVIRNERASHRTNHRRHDRGGLCLCRN